MRRRLGLFHVGTEGPLETIRARQLIESGLAAHAAQHMGVFIGSRHEFKCEPMVANAGFLVNPAFRVRAGRRAPPPARQLRVRVLLSAGTRRATRVPSAPTALPTTNA